MNNANRTIYKAVWLTADEMEVIQKKMLESGTSSFSAYCRKMMLKGHVVYYDFSILKELTNHIGKISGNINQIARHCNSSGFIGQDDYQALLKNYLELRTYCKELLKKKLRQI